MKKTALIPNFILIISSLVLSACLPAQEMDPTQAVGSDPGSTPEAVTTPPDSLPEAPYVVVQEDLVTCFGSPGRNESRRGIDPQALVDKGGTYHVLEITTNDENTFPVYAWYRIEDPSTPGTYCWLPATSVDLVGDPDSIARAEIPPTATWSGMPAFIEPRTGDIQCWYGPAESWGVAGTLLSGSRHDLTSLYEGGDWYQVENPEVPFTYCWVRWIDIFVYNDLSQVPVMSPADFPGLMAAEAAVNCRTDPGAEAEVVGTLDTGILVPIVAVLPDHSWYLIQNPDHGGTVCWVFESVIQFSGDLAKVPILSVEP
jgi:hypothetical protein